MPSKSFQSVKYIKTNITGDFNHVGAGRDSSQDLIASIAATRLKPAFTVPFYRDSLFVGRKGILQDIQDRLASQQRVVLTGIGGVGKSQIAIEYCYRHRDDNPNSHVFWVHCSNYTRFEQAFKEIGRKLKIPLSNDPNVDALQVVKEWLSADENGSWLMVVDNADDMEVLYGPGSNQRNKPPHPPFAALTKYLPQSSQGRLLITTRDRRVGDRLAMQYGKPIPILPFGHEDARQLLLNRIPESDQYDHEGITELFETLYYLPLAIAQAAAFMREEDVDLEYYLGLLRTGDGNAKELLEQDYPEPGRDLESQQNSILLTWTLSFDQIKKQKPRAVDLLSLMAVLDFRGVPDILLREKNEGKVGFDTSVGALKAFSLITVEKKRSSFQMHRLVHLSILSWLEDEDMTGHWHEKALDAVVMHCPANGRYETWGAWEVMSPHVQAVLGYTFASRAAQLMRAHLLNIVAEYEEYQGQNAFGHAKALEAFEIRSSYLGKQNADTLESLSRVARALSRQDEIDQHAESEVLYRQVWEARKASLGEEHRLTLESMNSVVEDMRGQGKNVDARDLSKAMVRISERVLGSDDPLTLKGRNNLAALLSLTDQLEEAEIMHRKILASYQRTLGKEDPETLYSMNDLALHLDRLGKYEEAEGLYRTILRPCRAILGPDNQYTLNVISNLAINLSSQRRYSEAVELHSEALSSYTRTKGPESGLMQGCMRNLATCLGELGKQEEAEDVTKKLLDFMIRTFGLLGAGTVNIRSDLTRILSRLGRSIEAETLLRPILTTQLQSLDFFDGKIDSTKASLLFSLGQKDKRAASEERLRVLFDENVHQLGRLDPRTLMLARSRIICMSRQGKFEDAEKMSRLMLAAQLEVCDLGDLRVIETQRRLAFYLKQQGKTEEAEQIVKEMAEHQEPFPLIGINLDDGDTADFDAGFSQATSWQPLTPSGGQVMDEFTSALGNDEMYALTTTMNDLGVALNFQEKYDEAETLYREAIHLRIRSVGKRNATTALTMANLQKLLMDCDRNEEALRIGREIVAARKELCGPENPLYLDSLHVVTVLLTRLKQYAEAEETLIENVAASTKAFGPKDPRTLDRTNSYFLAIYAQERYQDAVDLARREMESRTELLGREHPSALWMMYVLAVAMAEIDRDKEGKLYDESERLLQEVISLSSEDEIAKQDGPTKGLGEHEDDIPRKARQALTYIYFRGGKDHLVEEKYGVEETKKLREEWLVEKERLRKLKEAEKGETSEGAAPQSERKAEALTLRGLQYQLE